MMGALRANYGSGFHRVGNGGGWRQFGKRPAAFRINVTCLTGHMPWGLHRFVDYPWTYATMLRHPVDRVVSLYWFVRCFSKHRYHRAAQKMGLADFATSGAFADLDNGMTRFLSGRRECGSLKGRRPVDDTDLKLAMGHLAGMSAVGFVETFDASLGQMADRFGWEHVDCERKMVGKKHTPPTEEQRGAIARHNRFDMALYEYALGLEQ